jgi:hypothetical protein
MQISAEMFHWHGYALLQSVVNRELAGILRDYSLEYATGGFARSDRQVPDTPAAYGDPLMEDLLESLVPLVEECCGRKLYPTYSYFRVYKSGDILPKHTDRDSCEISLSLCLGYRAPKPWPLYIQGASGVFAACLEPGDGLLYKGVECLHWREPFEGDYASQAFLHYVDQDGDRRSWRYDKRASLRRQLINRQSGQ